MLVTYLSSIIVRWRCYLAHLFPWLQSASACRNLTPWHLGISFSCQSSTMMAFQMKKQVVCRYAKCLVDCVSKLPGTYKRKKEESVKRSMVTLITKTLQKHRQSWWLRY